MVNDTITPQQYFEHAGYVILRDALDKKVCKELTDYMFKLFEEGKLTKDDQCPLSDSVYGDPIFDDILQKFAKPIGDHVGRELLPTYTYARIYRKGEVLKKHKDRPACEISATMTLGYDGLKVWPIFFDEEKEIPVDLDVGEMAVYKGCEISHWRPIFKGKWQVQVFFHYVDANGPYKDEYKDKRESFGVDKSKRAANPNDLTFPNPVFNSIVIPPADESYPGYICFDKNNLPQLMFTKEECEKIIALTEEDYSNSASIGGSHHNSAIKKSIRAAQIYNIEQKPENLWIYGKVASVVSFANKHHFGYDLAGILHSIQLIHYSADEEVKGHYDWHIDCGPGNCASRKISYVAQLSDPDDYEGCELVINNMGTVIEATKERGSVHLFPSYTVHKVDPIKKGNRYSLVIWIHGSGRFR